jgi:hypothetical protein
MPGRRPSTCHPKQPYFSKGLCRACYNRSYVAAHPKKRFLTRAAVEPASCHPHRRRLTKGKFEGLCAPCATKAYRDARKAQGRPYAHNKVCGVCACGSPAVYGRRLGRLACTRCYGRWRYRQGGWQRRQLARWRRANESVQE